MKHRIGACVLLTLLLSLPICSSSLAQEVTGDVFVLGRDSDLGKHLWRFTLDGTYIGDIAPDNSYGGIVNPCDGFLYGADVYTGDLTRMEFDGSNKQPIDLDPNPTSVMGDWLATAHADGQGGILMTPFGYAEEPRTLVRYPSPFEANPAPVEYTGMQHSGGIVADYEAGLVFSTGASVWDHGLYSFPWDGGPRTPINPDVDGGYDMAIDRENDILFVGYTSSTVEKYNYAGERVLPDLNVGQPSYTLEYDALTSLLFSGSYSTGTARAVDMDGSVIYEYVHPDMDKVSAIAVHTIPEPATIWILALGGGALIKRRR